MNDLFLKACRREPTSRTPIWLMRQAGRYMPEYRALRERYSLLEICKHPELALQVTLQPVRLGVDACILFADILLPLEPMGIHFYFEQGEGPVLERSISSSEDVERLSIFEPRQELGYVLEAVRLIKRELAGKLPLITFAGAPFTLASYLIEGGKTRQFLKTKRLMYSNPLVWHSLMMKLAEVIRDYLRAQVEAGADAVQLFDSWVGQLSPLDYETYVFPYTTSILGDVVKMGVPVIHFGTGTHSLLPLQKKAGGTVIGLDWRVPLVEGWRLVGEDVAIQGNLDPAVLLAPVSVVKAHAARILYDVAGRPGHIFNLGHGVFPQTPVEIVQELIEFVKMKSSSLSVIS
ncbi:uroporphyrinogen decarboxylase [Pajaroellobacter abortibovis]|nr:uroporphyrinogen decarboxylase [Pajaroellobacter abortibovis]